MTIRYGPPQETDVAIVGAGAAGVGMGVVLRDLGIADFVVLDRHGVGASFEMWPEGMRFITPSFMGNAFGMTDLNAVALGTSPAYTLRREHPTGREYAAYLRGVARHFELPVHAGVEIEVVETIPGGGFRISTSEGDIRSRFVVWAAGEFQYPNLRPFPGAGLCLHNSYVRSWDRVGGEEVLVVGGFESGMDAAVNLSALGKRVCVLDAASWKSDAADPSRSLSPYTRERLEVALATGLVELVEDVGVTRVEKEDPFGYAVHGTGGRRWLMPDPPVLATGFSGGLGLVSHLFDLGEHGEALLSDEDESTRTPGLFLCGPQVRHDNLILCFIYKFRGRFAVVANAIAQGLGVDASPLDFYRANGMFLDDLSCCKDECAC